MPFNAQDFITNDLARMQELLSASAVMAEAADSFPGVLHFDPANPLPAEPLVKVEPVAHQQQPSVAMTFD